MIDRRSALLVVISSLAAAAVGCGQPEKVVVDKYFGAVNQEDNQTLTSFSAVVFNKKVDAWEIKSATPEQRSPAPLPELLNKVKEIQAEIDQNKREYMAYFNEHPKEVDQVQELLKKPDARIPSSLQKTADDWKVFLDKKRELDRSLAQSKAEVEREKRNVMLSVGQVDNVEALTGEMVNKQLDLALTINGQPQDYVMTLRKYDLEGGGGPRMVSRWVVQDLAPKG
jgi:hypothetical protein